MAKDTHVTAPTRFVEANGIRYAYRRFGSESGTPLVFLQHFRGGLDNWDPLVTDGLAQGRPVILFNNAGVASSSGETPDTVEAMADHLAAFVNALGLPQIDVTERNPLQNRRRLKTPRKPLHQRWLLLRSMIRPVRIP
jgi:hypothetical protein